MGEAQKDIDKECDKVVSKLFETIPADFLPRDPNDPKTQTTHDLHKILSGVLLDLAFVSILRLATLPTDRTQRHLWTNDSAASLVEWAMGSYWLASRLSLAQKREAEWKERVSFVVEISRWVDHIERRKTPRDNRGGVVFDFVSDRLGLMVYHKTSDVQILWKVFRGLMERGDCESASRLLSNLKETDEKRCPIERIERRGEEEGRGAKQLIVELVEVWLDQDVDALASLFFRFPLHDLCCVLPGLEQFVLATQTEMISLR